MLFTHVSFIFYFLPVALFFHYLAVRKTRSGRYPNIARLLVFVLTLGFYGVKDPWWLIPLMVCIIFDFVWATLLGKATDARVRKFLVTLSIAQNLSLLMFFKYWNFLIESIASLVSGWLGTDPILGLRSELSLPAGISFYTFESLSFIIDVYRHQVTPPKNPLEFFGFIGMFPRFIAGPIVRYKDMVDQFSSYKGMQLESGLFLFVVGLFLKTCFADSFSVFTPYAFRLGTAIDFLSAWVGTIAYGMQIYFDFSGYSLMAIGLGRCLGFQFPNNFNRPYHSKTVTEYWRNWHISLSSWLRDYVYLPLGGNQRGRLRTYFNLFITMTLGGLWHGAGGMFIVWGMYHGAIIVFERAVPAYSRIPPSITRKITFLLVTLGWPIFHGKNVEQTTNILKTMLNPFREAWAFNPEAFRVFPVATALCVLALFYVMFLEEKIDFLSFERIEQIPLFHQVWSMGAFVVSMLIVKSEMIIPFLYFQF